MLNLLVGLIPMFVTDEIEGTGELEDGQIVDGVLVVKSFTWLCFDYCYNVEFLY